MALVSISEAARLAGISRTHLYKKYLAEGIISKTTDAVGNSVIDTSEILRVFGKLHGQEESEHLETSSINSLLHAELQSENSVLKAKLEMMQQLLDGKDERIADLKQSLVLIEQQKPKKRFFGLF